MVEDDMVVEGSNIPKVSKAEKRRYIDQIVDEHVPHKKEKFEKHLYKPPTREEFNQLTETENLFQSNLFRLQVDEVLKAVKVKEKLKNLFRKWFENFKAQVNKIDVTQEFKLEDDLLSEESGIRIPMKQLVNECCGTFRFSPPSNIVIGGSHSLDTTVGPNAQVDVLIEMPKKVFQRADNSNYKYMRKKAIYLAIVANNIPEELAEHKCFVGHNLNPILKIVPTGKLSRHTIVYVHFVAEYTTFQHNRFTPEKNNIKPNWYFNNDETMSDQKPPTPIYNHRVMYDLTTIKSNTDNVSKMEEYPNIRDGIILLKIWLKQRGLCNNFDSFNGHVITMYVLYLLHKKIINKYMSSYQILRHTWTNLAKSEWHRNGISMCLDEKTNDKIALYKKHYDCVFLDSTGFCNITANVTESIAEYVSDQASMAIACLDKSKMSDFQVLFMRKVPFYVSFDHVLWLYNGKALKNVVDAKSSNADKLNYDSDKYVQTVKFMTNFLKKGLQKRISLVTAFPRNMKEWNLNERVPDDLEKMYIGIQLNPDCAFDIIEKGPEANLPEAEKFRKYWGSKSDLRRFKDSTICETVVWLKEDATLAQRRTIPCRIIKYILEQKLKLFKKSHFLVIANQVDELLKPKKLIVPKVPYGTEEVALRAIKAFDSLKNDLSQLGDELPLSIHDVQGCSPVFRYTEVFPPQTFTRRPDEKTIISDESHLLFANTVDSPMQEVPLYLSPIEATMQFSMSGKWPDDLEALRMTKAAFYIQIADCVRKRYKLHAHGSMNHLDIMKNGLIFRLRIANQKEISLVKQVIDDTGLLMYRDNEESIELEKNLFQLPKITGALHGLHCRNPTFGPACCLVKRWLSAQLIDDSHMPGLVVELLLASMYLNTDPYRPPQVPQVAFIRFLEIFARAYWITDPIIVNFNNEMTREEVLEIENLFGENRDSLPLLFISSQYDKASNWTRKAPCTLILNRITDLAKASLNIIEKQIFKGTGLSLKPIFIPPMSEYDCSIKLKTSLCARRFEAIKIDDGMPNVFLNWSNEHPKAKIPIVDFDPVTLYLKELRSAYSDFALFFHDTYGGTVIGVLLKPCALQEKDFKVANTSCRKISGDNKLILNMSAMIEDFYILGKGLVQNIDIQSKNLKAV
ncbi:nucleolar protein 6 [Copidosoma floridanum]|uniref:nucleolar protein 6 n=1 Tax=Copidosoma floridanum TaxID=29053 RepID=UPI0006C96F20|nr:nucleolar protein 6 [Copidosoma floridanum]